MCGAPPTTHHDARTCVQLSIGSLNPGNYNAEHTTSRNHIAKLVVRPDLKHKTAWQNTNCFTVTASVPATTLLRRPGTTEIAETKKENPRQAEPEISETIPATDVSRSGSALSSLHGMHAARRQRHHGKHEKDHKTETTGNPHNGRA